MFQFTEKYLDKKVCPGVSILETILSPTKKSSLDQPHHVIPHALHSINLIRITFFFLNYVLIKDLSQFIIKKCKYTVDTSLYHAFCEQSKEVYNAQVLKTNNFHGTNNKLII